MKVEQDLPHPFYVEIALEPEGTEVVGTPLIGANAHPPPAR